MENIYSDDSFTLSNEMEALIAKIEAKQPVNSEELLLLANELRQAVKTIHSMELDIQSYEEGYDKDNPYADSEEEELD